MYDTTQRSVFTYTGLYSGFKVDLFQWYILREARMALCHELSNVQILYNQCMRASTELEHIIVFQVI